MYHNNKPLTMIATCHFNIFFITYYRYQQESRCCKCVLVMHCSVITGMASYRESVAGGLSGGGGDLRGCPADGAEPRGPAPPPGHLQPLLSLQHSVIRQLQGNHQPATTPVILISLFLNKTDRQRQRVRSSL